jgi:simple sugar transport system ATP-binding protein
VARTLTGETDARSLAREMVGREVSLRHDAAALGLLHEAEAVATADVTATGPDIRQVVLRVDDARHRARDGRVLLDGCSLEVRRGEILGVAGVEGNGQSALGDLLSSLLTLDSGSVEVDGRPVRSGRPGAMAAAGVAVIPEDRHQAGCVLGMTVAENLVLDDLDGVCRHRMISDRLLRARAEELIARFDIKTPSPDTPMSQLSGGNQQRVVLARAIKREPKVLVAAQPTHGLDVGAVEHMTGQLRAVAGRGVAVLLISTELEEVLSLSDRIAVMHGGRVLGVLDRAEADLERIGLLMGGHVA